MEHTVMTLPRRKPKPAKRSSRWRSQAHCNWLRGFMCAINNSDCEGATEVAHVRKVSGAGMGQKPDDWRAVPLCKHHHQKQHTMGEDTFWRDEYESQWRGQGQDCSVEFLIDELCRASPKAAEIRKERERGMETD